MILLVVEDSEMRGYLGGCLAQKSTEVAAILEADSLPAAKRRAADRGIDVIIAEGATADGSGMELYRALRGESEFQMLPVILVVDEPISEEMRRATSPTMRILARPFNASRLCEAVRTTIGAGAKPNQTRVR